MEIEPESDLIFRTRTRIYFFEPDPEPYSQFHLCAGLFRKVKNYPTPVSIWVHLKLIEPKEKHWQLEP
jgi:hypothetical protein